MTTMLAKLKLYFAHIFATIAVLLGIGSVAYVTRVVPAQSDAPKFGASVPGPCRQIGVSKWVCTTATDWALCAADASITCLPPALPPVADASLENVALLVDFQATGVTCDGGFPCVGVIRRYMPGMNAGGVFVTPGWSTLDTPISSDLSAPLGVATAVISYSSGKPAGTMYCPIASAVSCVFDIDYSLSYNPASYDGALPDAGDSGSDAADAGDAADAADAGDAADAADAGPPPTIASIYPDFASASQPASGGELRTLQGANLGSAGTTTVTVDSNTACSPSGTNCILTGSGGSMTVTFAVPASSVSTSDGNGSASVVTVATGVTPNASTTGAALNELWYWPGYFTGNDGGAARMFSSADIDASAGTVTVLYDLASNGAHKATQMAGGGPATACTMGLSGTIPCLQFHAATENRLEDLSVPALSVPVTYIWMGSQQDQAAQEVIAAMPASSFYLYWVGGAIGQYNAQNQSGTIPIDAGLLAISQYSSSTNSSVMLSGAYGTFDGGSPTVTTSAGGWVIGGHPSAATWYSFNRTIAIGMVPWQLSEAAKQNLRAYAANEHP